jgi:hypothetical protein
MLYILLLLYESEIIIFVNNDTGNPYKGNNIYIYIYNYQVLDRKSSMSQLIKC